MDNGFDFFSFEQAIIRGLTLAVYASHIMVLILVIFVCHDDIDVCHIDLWKRY